MAALHKEEDILVRLVSSGIDAARVVKREAVSLVIADVRSNRATPMDTLSHVRRHADVPVLLLTDGDSDLAGACLELGADDCMNWPASERELIARVRLRSAGAQVRRNKSPTGVLELDADHRTVRIEGRIVELRGREFDLLSYMAASPGVVFTSQQLLGAVWGSQPGWQSVKTVTEHIYRLRKKVETDPKNPALIVTVPRCGYRLDT